MSAEIIKKTTQLFNIDEGEYGQLAPGEDTCGQRQRIGIARARLNRPAVLVFDEATSGLDDAFAEHIGATVNFLKGKVTVLFIAHKVPRCLRMAVHIKL